ncbi:MAG: DUF86 domain-containing protein [Planctomycetes bacterium]|nr:DUF86 domain-containing protein [Planctomycetota bacterium]
MANDPLVFIEHIIESILLIEEYTKNKTKADFNKSKALQDMVIRRLEIIGEAVKNLDAQTKTKSPETPWRQISGMRDVLTH